jgi:hypothetical protein
MERSPQTLNRQIIQPVGPVAESFSIWSHTHEPLLLPTDGKPQIRSSQDAEPETLLGNASPVGCRQILVLS